MQGPTPTRSASEGAHRTASARRPSLALRVSVSPERFPGSARRDSYNKKLVRIAAAGASLAGGEVTVVDLQDYPMPLFDQEYETEHGAPGNGGTANRGSGTGLRARAARMGCVVWQPHPPSRQYGWQTPPYF